MDEIKQGFDNSPMTVKQVKDWLSFYPDDFQLMIVTEYGNRDISPIGEISGKHCALVILPAEIIEKVRKGELE